MAARKAEFHVEGLKETMLALGELDRNIARELRGALKHAADIVVEDARARVPSVTGTAAEGIKARSTAGGITGAASASVVESRSVPYLHWLDFGSRTPVTGNTRAEGPWRGSGAGPKGGRFLYPAIEAKEPQIVATLILAIEKAQAGTGF